LELKNHKIEMASRAAILYYRFNKSQEETARELNVSRSYVSQLLTYARQSGIVEVNINVNNSYGLEIEFTKKFNIKNVYIMNTTSEEFTRKNIGQFAAPHVTRLIKNSKIIGLNQSNSVLEVLSKLNPNDFCYLKDKIVIQIMGGCNYGGDSQSPWLPQEMVYKMGQILNCKHLYLNCPAIVNDKELRDFILKEQVIKEVTDYWDKLELVIMGIGMADENSKIFRMLNKSMKDDVKALQGSCEININFFNDKGEYVPVLEENRISIPYSKLKKTSNKVIVCYDKKKAKAILAALRADMIDILFIDSIVAEDILSLS